MSELRLILLAAGVVLIAGIYWYSRRQKRGAARHSERREPSFETFVSESDAVPSTRASEYGSPAAARQQPAAEPLQPADEAFQQADLPLPEELRPEIANAGAAGVGGSAVTDVDQKEMVIVVNIAARGGKRFGGPEIVAALQAEQMEFGDFNIFHRRSGGRSVFSAASMVEPGTFDLDAIDRFSTPGVSLFLVLPGPDSPIAAFTEMLSVARRLATALGGEVLDESGSTLSRQAASHLREQIINFSHRVR